MSLELHHTCPFCRAEHDRLSVAYGHEPPAPADGDVSFCFKCGEWAIFDRHWTGGTRKPTHKEYEEIIADPAIVKVRDAWLKLERKR